MRRIPPPDSNLAQSAYPVGAWFPSFKLQASRVISALHSPEEAVDSSSLSHFHAVSCSVMHHPFFTQVLLVSAINVYTFPTRICWMRRPPGHHNSVPFDSFSRDRTALSAPAAVTVDKSCSKALKPSPMCGPFHAGLRTSWNVEWITKGID